MSRMTFEWASTHCGLCQMTVPPFVYPDGSIRLCRLCPECDKKQRKWAETHCTWCKVELPLGPSFEGFTRLCDRCADIDFPQEITEADIPQ